VEAICDGGDGQTLVVEGVDLSVTTFVPHLDATRGWKPGCFTVLVQPGQVVNGALLVHWREDAHGHALERSREVVHDVPSVCDLHGAWGVVNLFGIMRLDVASDASPPDWTCLSAVLRGAPRRHSTRPTYACA